STHVESTIVSKPSTPVYQTKPATSTPVYQASSAPVYNTAPAYVASTIAPYY
ncbi:hypothetical protein EC988_007309, partial [Linderina pennispora]